MWIRDMDDPRNALRATALESPPCVVVSVVGPGDTAIEPWLTPQDARQLGKTLIQMADEAEGK